MSETSSPPTGQSKNKDIQGNSSPETLYPERSSAYLLLFGALIYLLFTP